MSNNIELRHEESAVLARGVERVFRKLASFLIGRISLVKLQEILKFAYIEEIELKLQRENPNKNIPLSQFALLSGLDTRTLTKVRNDRRYRRPLHQETHFLEEITPGTSILDAWCSREPYFDPESGAPKELNVSGSTESFEALFDEFTISRGLTYKSLMKRLIASGAVSLDEKAQKLTLVTNSYLPSGASDNLGAIELGFSALGNLIGTITHNINALERGENRFYQRGAWSYRVSVDNKAKLQTELRELLKETDHKARLIIGNREDETERPDQFIAGVSLFYFEDQSH